MTRRDALVAAALSAALPARLARAADAPKGAPIVIGWVGPLSPPGGYAEGILMKDGAQMAVDEVNAKGGALGRKIEVISRDDAGKPADAIRLAGELVNDQK
ncbi:MAG: ABC transporter substrate-binding protein, partial [Acetobacteraceae bacterium]